MSNLKKLAEKLEKKYASNPYRSELMYTIKDIPELENRLIDIDDKILFAERNNKEIDPLLQEQAKEIRNILKWLRREKMMKNKPRGFGD